jgi:hypothetical protein
MVRRTTAYTAITQLGAVTGMDPEADRHIVYGPLAGDYSPGDPVVLVDGVWTLGAKATVAHLLKDVGIVAHLGSHRDKNGVNYDIDDALDISEFNANSFPIHCGGTVIAKFTDPTATKDPGDKVVLGANALEMGAAASQDLEGGKVLAEHTISGDVFAVVKLKAFNPM